MTRFLTTGHLLDCPGANGKRGRCLEPCRVFRLSAFRTIGEVVVKRMVRAEANAQRLHKAITDCVGETYPACSTACNDDYCGLIHARDNDGIPRGDEDCQTEPAP
jgi:hypothetical protein